ncbi:MAG TPA: hypothetical protein VFQ25_04045 [Ktedonobacterales bacterium]|nr:hypothetical protein [Ktedonobacterales bacterium]
MGMPAAGGTPTVDEKRTAFVFDEYRSVAEDTAKITDRRQTVNTLFVTINALFLTGVGYLFLQFFQTNSGDLSITFLPGFLAIAIITHLLNNTWLRLSEQSRKLIDLRIRYLKALEDWLRGSGYFPDVDTELKGDEAPPLTLGDVEVTHPNSAGAMRRWMRTRGTYSIEDLFYGPKVKKEPFGFSRAEQRIGAIFTWSYWLAFAVSVIAIAVQLGVNLAGIHFQLGPYGF